MSAADNRGGHGTILFLDTPRAGEGLNHRFFVAKPADCDEAQVVRWAMQARENSSGPDYLAVSRPVSQVSNGQTRSGTELLVFAGIKKADPEQNARILARLDSMLDILQQNQVATEGSGAGLFMPSRQIAEFQRELLVQTASAQTSTTGANPTAPSRRRGKLKLILMLSSIVAVVVFVLAQNGTPDGERCPPTDNETKPASKKKKDPERDWSFLRDDRDWQSLTRLTAFHGGQSNATVAQTWAKNLLTAVDPGWQAGEATPEELKQNKHVKSLLDAVRSASGENQTPDAESVSKQWLSSFPSNDINGLLEFWSALRGKKGMNPAALKKLLLDWEQKLIAAASHPTDLASLGEELRPFATLKKEPATTGIQILVQPDLDRFLRMKTFFDSVGFNNAIAQSAYGENWKSRDWPERFRKLKGLSSDGNASLPSAIRVLCKKLSDTVEP